MSIPDDCEEIILSRRFHLSDPPPPRPGRHGTPPGEKLDDAALTARVEAFARAIEDRDEDSALEVLCELKLLALEQIVALANMAMGEFSIHRMIYGEQVSLPL